jgi:hypothetical protein
VEGVLMDFGESDSRDNGPLETIIVWVVLISLFVMFAVVRCSA